MILTENEDVDTEILDQMNINNKETTLNNPTVCLINSAKNKLRGINTAIRDNINRLSCTNLNFNQCKKKKGTVTESFKRM